MQFIKSVNKKISKALILAFAILIIGGIITYYENMIGQIQVPEKVDIIVANRDIKIGDIITGAHLTQKTIYTPDKLEDGIISLNELIGKVALTTIVKGKEITAKEIITKENWFSQEEREVGITFGSYTDIVGGAGKPGDIIDFMISYPPVEKATTNIGEIGEKIEVKEILIREPKEVVASIEIIETYNESNASYISVREKDTFKPYTILVRLSKDQEALIDMAKKEGRLYLRRHGNYMRYMEDTKDKDDSKVIISVGD